MTQKVGNAGLVTPSLPNGVSGKRVQEMTRIRVMLEDLNQIKKMVYGRGSIKIEVDAQRLIQKLDDKK